MNLTHKDILKSYGCSFIRIETVLVSNMIQPTLILISAVHYLEFEIPTFNERSSTEGLGKLFLL